MKKTDLIALVADITEGTKVQAGQIVESIFDTITAKVAKGEDVEIAGFGKFVRVKRSARTARNPQTGEAINVPEKNAPKFSPAKAFKDRVL
jgi:DNA-binding protein HU-beta